jgi:hypothetical protein
MKLGRTIFLSVIASANADCAQFNSTACNEVCIVGYTTPNCSTTSGSNTVTIITNSTAITPLVWDDLELEIQSILFGNTNAINCHTIQFLFYGLDDEFSYCYYFNPSDPPSEIKPSLCRSLANITSYNGVEMLDDSALVDIEGYITIG